MLKTSQKFNNESLRTNCLKSKICFIVLVGILAGAMIPSLNVSGV